MSWNIKMWKMWFGTTLKCLKNCLLKTFFTFFPELVMDAELTDEQKKFLAECEAEFSNRYTTDDKDFTQVHIFLLS